MKRTTIMADEALLLAAKHLADYQQKTLSRLVQDALSEYIAAHRPPRRISFIGLGENDGPPLTVEEQDRLLREGLDPIEGWSSDRSAPRRSQASEADRRSRP